MSKTSFSLRSDIATLSEKFDANKDLLDLIRVTDLPALYALLDSVHKFQTFLVFATDDLLLSADTERTKTDRFTSKIKEFLAFFPGVYRISFDIKTNGDPFYAYARIYKNDVAYGTTRATIDTVYTTFTEDLLFETSDHISLNVSVERDGDICYIRNFRIYGAISQLPAQVITD
ncbi:MAG: hypothetical protein GH151_10550 [Bacteroidetes bacterium]|nr:hypothetical protein [Bacteroidota bacterium]